MLQAVQDYPADRESTDEVFFVDHFQNEVLTVLLFIVIS